MIGAGNVAWHLSQALKKANYIPIGVYSRHKTKAEALAEVLNCRAFDSLDNIIEPADLFFISVKDDAIADVFEKIRIHAKHSLIVHTAGSVSIDIFKDKTDNYGVLYPLQSFSIKRKLDFSNVPLFVEGNNAETTSLLLNVAENISRHKATILDSEHRKKMHLAAVFASNFTNHCYACAKQLLNESGVSFDAMLPLIDETCRKTHDLSPEEAQTGPAVRYDKNVMAMQESVLQGAKLDIYRCMSRSIHETAIKIEDKNDKLRFEQNQSTRI